MKTVGHRKPREIAPAPSGALLAETGRANDARRAFPEGDAGFIPKGVYHFATHAEANRHWEECLARSMARRARNRR